MLDTAQSVVGRVASAKNRITRFAGGVNETIRDTVADARAALAVDRSMSDGNWSESSVQSGKLPKSSAGGSFMKGGGKKPVSGSASSWANSQSGGGQVAKSSRFENWVKAEQKARPHCYGIVDPDNLPAD